MNIPITQPSPIIAGDLEFTQPRYHFGQMLEDEKGRLGFVFAMHFDGEWHYQLFYTQSCSAGNPIPENLLAIATATVEANTAQPLLEGS